MFTGICSTDKKKKDSITPGMQKKYPTLDKQELFKGGKGIHQVYISKIIPSLMFVASYKQILEGVSR